MPAKLKDAYTNTYWLLVPTFGSLKVETFAIKDWIISEVLVKICEVAVMFSQGNEVVVVVGG